MGAPGSPKNEFYDRKDVVFLSEYLLKYPCCVYIHLTHALMHKRLKTYIFSQHVVKNDREQIDAYSFPVKHMTHDYICQYFQSILFKHNNIVALEPYKKSVSILPAKRAMTYDFCTPDSLPKIAPQIAYVLSEFASKSSDKHFDAENARDLFYACAVDVCSHTPHTLNPNRLDWELPMDDLWLDSRHKEEFLSTEFKRESLLPNYRDALVNGGVTLPEKIAQLMDERFPGQITDHEMGELILPLLPSRENSRELISTNEYERVRQKGRYVRQKYLATTS